MKKRLLLLLILGAVYNYGMAQRIYQKMGRGVVAVTRSSGAKVTVSWRKLTNDPDSCTYNLYKRKQGSTAYTKVNSTPYKNTNVQLTSSVLPYNYELAVTTVDKNGKESEKSVPYLYKQQPWHNVWMRITLDNTVLPQKDYHVKYCWPADLDGDGEMNEFIVDRLGGGSYDEEDESTETTSTNHKIQAYTIDGTLLWTVALGPNVNISSGQNDMIVAYDIDCDGKSEVVIKSSDGTQFWDKANNKWGKYVFGKDTPDTDGDGIVDYCASTNIKRNPPFYISVIDGMTGAEKVSAELNYAEVHDNEDQYSRDNKDTYWQTKGYYQMGGHFAITYDGVHPLLMMKCLDRDVNTGHHDYVFAFSYDWNDGKPTNFHHSYTWSRNDKTPWPAEFHGNRVCDVDGDGIDELIPGGWAVNPQRGMIASPGIGHGDRFTVTDIDPTRPGLEEYAIQQTSMLGQLIYDPATGERIKEWYLPTAFDVGRGQCVDVDSTRLGLECYSFVSDYIYDCKGNMTSTKRPYPNEPVWWDGDLLREVLASPGGSGYGTNMHVAKLPNDGTRLAQFTKEASYATHGCTGTRPDFWGDIKGDWREEIILTEGSTEYSWGIVGYATDYTTDKTITCLQEDPHYRLDCTTKGYYQSPNTDFYLGHGMPKEPVYPCVETDLRYQSGEFKTGTWTSYDQTQSLPYADGKSIMFDISGKNSSEVSLNADIAPSALFLMNPKGHDYTISGTGAITGTATITKGMQGNVTLNCNLNNTGKTVISEGVLYVNGKIESPLYLMARGSLGGNAVINSPIWFEGGMNYEGCRLILGNSDKDFGTMTFNRNLVLPGNVYINTNLETATGKVGKLVVNGNLSFNNTNTIRINCTEAVLTPGTYTLAECTGTLTADVDKIIVSNLLGIPYELQLNSNRLELRIDKQREAAEGVTWVGGETSTWDYLNKNFSLNNENTYFVTNDKVVFNDSAKVYDIKVNGTLITKGIEFNNTKKYTLSGDGCLSGIGNLVKNGTGELVLDLPNSDYTGNTIINGGRLTITSLADAGKKSCIGAAAATKGNLVLNGAELYVDADNAATDRQVTVTDTVLINLVKSSLSFKGLVSGKSVLIKDGAGQLNFSYGGNNRLSELVIRKGTVNQGVWNATFGNTGMPITMEGGSIRMCANTSMSTIPRFNNAFYIKEGTTNTIQGSYRSTMQGSVSGGGELTIQSGGVRCDIYFDFSKFTGTLKGSGDEFRLQSTVTDMKQTTFTPTGSIVVEPSASSLSIGALMGTEKTPIVKGKTINVGYLNNDVTYAGLLTASTVNKYGTGTWELTGTGSSSSIYVKQGTLRIRNYTGSLTSGSLCVESGAKLIGRGSTQSILLRKGSTISSGIDSINIGTLTTIGNFTSSGGSTIEVKVSSNSNSKYKIGGTLCLVGDTIRVIPVNGKTFKAGDAVQVFNGSITSDSKWTIDGGGYKWDDSQFLTTGKLICLKEPLAGDANDDDKVDVSDITAVAAYILSPSGKIEGNSAWNAVNADANRDGQIDVSDITTIANSILFKLKVKQ